MNDGTVLILARELLGNALLGALVEVLGRDPAFPSPNERGDAAVSRLRPALVLLDGHHSAARSESFFDAAASAGSRVVMFAPTAPWDDVAAIAARQGVTLVHPERGESLAATLARALDATGG
jgi:hypothetical protein